MTFKVHRLKTWPEFYWPILAGVKRFELRKNDRGFKPGDHLDLCEWDPRVGEYTGSEHTVEVVYMLEQGQVTGLAAGYCLLGIAELDQGEGA